MKIEGNPGQSWKVIDHIHRTTTTYTPNPDGILKTDIIEGIQNMTRRSNGVGVAISRKLPGAYSESYHYKMFPVDRPQSPEDESYIEYDMGITGSLWLDEASSNKALQFTYNSKGEVIAIMLGEFPHTQRSIKYGQLNPIARRKFISDRATSTNFGDLLEIVKTYGLSYVPKKGDLDFSKIAGISHPNFFNLSTDDYTAKQIAGLYFLINQIIKTNSLYGKTQNVNHIIANMLAGCYDQPTVLAKLFRNPETHKVEVIETLDSRVEPFAIVPTETESRINILTLSGRRGISDKKERLSLANSKTAEKIVIPGEIDFGKIRDVMSTRKSYGWDSVFGLFSIEYSKLVRE